MLFRIFKCDASFPEDHFQKDVFYFKYCATIPSVLLDVTMGLLLIVIEYVLFS